MGTLRSCGYLLARGLLSAACGGSAVDLGHERVGWADAPGISVTVAREDQGAPAIYQSEDRIIGFTLDETTLYALIAYADAYELVSCPVEQCGSQRTTLYRGARSPDSSPFLTQLHLVRGMVVWNQANESIFACPLSGCQDLTVVSQATGDIASDGERIYWVDINRSLFRWNPGTAAEMLGTVRLPQVGRIATDGDFVYTVDGLNLYRIPTDGSSDAEVIVSDDSISDVVTEGKSLFYAVNILTGSISECATADCASPRSVTKNQRWPGRIRISESELFWLNQNPHTAPDLRATLMSCRLPDCATVEQRAALSLQRWDGYAALPTYAVNARYLAWLDTFRSWGTALRLVRR